MKIFKGKAFFFKSILLHLFLIFIISIVSICFWENPISDAIINSLTKNVSGSDEISLIMIDNKSFESYRWPWARSLYAEIFEYLNNYTNAKVVIFDSVLNSLDKEHAPSADMYFFDTVSKSKNFVGGYMARSSEYENPAIGGKYDKDFQDKFSINILDKRSKKYSDNSYRSLTMFPKPYFDAQKQVGSVNLELSPIDGVLRAGTDLLSYKGNYYPSLALRAYMYANDATQLTLTNKYLIVDETNLKIPIENDYGDIRHNIKFYKLLPNSEFSHEKTSAIDIINSNRLIKSGKKPIIDPHKFDNRYVIIGANAMNVKDALETPISVSHPGADIQATILNNFINNEFLTNFPTSINVLIILILSILTFTIIRYLAFIPSLLTLIGVAIIYFILCIICFRHNLTPLVITPIAVQLSTMIFGYSYRFILEGKNKEKIKNAMGKYLSQDIMKNVVQNIDDIKLGGKKANVTVLFADIRGFTSMSEKMTAEEVSVILNEYFSEIEPIITKYNGVINKFIGDAVMAIFGEPIQDINHPQNAVKCACAMLKKVEELQEKWIFEGKPKIEIGIGINTGEAFVGNIGSEKRLEYTVIGDMVNLASRIESYNKVYKTNLLISSSTYINVSDIVNVIRIADVTIRGKAKKMDIYEVLGLSSEQ
jgi:adenylate cyclase